MTLADHVRTLGRGPGRSRSLSLDEAADAMSLMLQDDASPQAVGAILMLLRMKGEVAPEIAGFADAARRAVPDLPKADLDWPSYAAGRTRGAPWFLMSAKLVAHAGHRVLIHGWNGADPKVRAGLARAGIGVATDAPTAARLLDRDGIAYLPLERLHPALFRLLNLRDVLGLRSCVNTVCRMLNPAQAPASVQGVFHPSYRLLQADAAQLLGWQGLSVIKGGGGEFERHPGKDIAAFGLRSGALWDQTFPALSDQTTRLADVVAACLPDTPQSYCTFETDLVIGTAALALDTLGYVDGHQAAADLWAQSGSGLAA